MAATSRCERPLDRVPVGSPFALSHSWAELELRPPSSFLKLYGRCRRFITAYARYTTRSGGPSKDGCGM